MNRDPTHIRFDLKSVINPQFLIIGLSLGAVLCFCILFLLDVPSAYSALFVEPIIYVIFLNLFIKPRFLLGLGSSTLICMYFIKLCILPITTILGDFTSIVSSAIYNLYWNEGCFYIALEWIIVSFSIRIIGGHYLNKLSNVGLSTLYSCTSKNVNSLRANPIYYVTMAILFSAIVFFVILNRNLTSAFFFLWQMEDDTIGESGGPVWFMFKNFVEWVKPMILFWLTVKVYNSKIKNGKFFILLVIAFIPTIIMTEYRILSLITGLSIIGFTIAKFNKYRIFINILKIICVAFMFAAVSELTMHGDEISQTFSNLGRLLDGYCGGFIVAAASCSVHMDDGLLMFINDTVSGNPLSHIIFGNMPTTTEVINSSLNYSAKGTFYELMVQAKDFFGIFSPIAVGLCVFFLMKMDFYTLTEDVDLYRLFYIFCAVSVALFMVMYTYSMVTNFIIYKCLVWIIIIAVDRHVRIKA